VLAPGLQFLTLSAVKIPFYVSLPLALLTMGVIWWQGTKGKDFTTPPDAAALAIVKQEIREELKATDSIEPEEPAQAIRVKPKTLLMPNAEAEPQAAAEPTLKPEDFGDLSVSPGLDCYLAMAERGAAIMIDLATQLEIKGETQRALLAWERVLDATEADAAQQDTARKAVLRLRTQVPLWNVDPISTRQLVLLAGCDRERAKAIEPILQEMVASLLDISSGLVECKLELQAGAKPDPAKPRQPIALSFRGSSAGAPASKTLTLPTLPESLPEQKNLLRLQCYKLIRDGISSQANLRPLAEPPTGSDAESLLRGAITRRTWSQWAESMTTETR
jgi:hypothetical protein